MAPAGPAALLALAAPRLSLEVRELLAAILGHAQPSTTLNVYGHAVPSNMRAAAERLGRTLRRPPGQAVETA